MNAENNEVYSLYENTVAGSQKRFIAEIFESRKYEWISKREVEAVYSLKFCFKNMDKTQKYTLDEILEFRNLQIPGDVQRQLRTFYDEFNKYGLEKREKSDLYKEVSYKWNPILKEKTHTIIQPALRDIFKTKEKVEEFKKSKKGCCEMCGTSAKDNECLRLAVDHWRAHSIYNIDSENIAVLLCEKCNNIHHNKDASQIALKYKSDMRIVTNWRNKELEIRSKGYMPNNADLQAQQENIKKIIIEQQAYGVNLDVGFWKSLI